MGIICSTVLLVYVLPVISARDVAPVYWEADLSFLSQTVLKKYLKVCINISGGVRQMRTPAVFALS